ncbi:hypothetical protein ES703_57414 [subsurface metagenome]
MKLKLVKFVSAIAIAVLLLVLSCAVPPETSTAWIAPLDEERYTVLPSEENLASRSQSPVSNDHNKLPDWTSNSPAVPEFMAVGPERR